MQRTFKVTKVTVSTIVSENGVLCVKEFTHEFPTNDERKIKKKLNSLYSNYLVGEQTVEKRLYKMDDETFMKFASLVE